MEINETPNTGTKTMLTKNWKIVDEILHDTNATYSIEEKKVAIKINATTYTFEFLGSGENANWYFTSHSTFGNWSGVTGDDTNATGYILIHEHAETMENIASM